MIGHSLGGWKDDLSKRLERLVKRALDDQARELSSVREGLDASTGELSRLHSELFEWCGELSARSGELNARYEELSARFFELSVRFGDIMTELGLVRAEVAALGVPLDEIMRRQDAARDVALADFDGLPTLRRKLLTARDTEEYARAFSEREPLISVTIATYNRPKLLVTKAIRSVLAQTYQNFEIVIVGDGCDVETGEAVAAVGDGRITYENLSMRGTYPSDPVRRWYVAGSIPHNTAIERARGTWIAPLDEDDEFTPSHLEELLNAARDRRHELVYGQVLQRFSDGREKVIGSFPPEQGQFNFGGALFSTALRFFEYSPRAWVAEEPGDWRKCRQMMEAGVRVGFVDKVVTLLNVTGPRFDGPETGGSDDR